VARLPPARQNAARLGGLMLAMATRIALLFSIVWLTHLRQPWLRLAGQAFSARDVVLLLGGLPSIDVVGAAADGEQALALVAEHDPDAILLDLHMPVLDGIAATRRLTAEHPGVAVVILTTYADDESVLDALRAGARSYLTKDADRADIASALGDTSRLDEKTRARTEEANLRRLVREKFGLPRLTLF